jgi:hypothetical protein
MRFASLTQIAHFVGNFAYTEDVVRNCEPAWKDFKKEIINYDEDEK